MADYYKIAESWMGVWVRRGPGVSYAKKTVIYGKDNKEYKVTERKNKYWLHIPSLDGWCCSVDSDGTTVMKKTKNATKDDDDNDGKVIATISKVTEEDATKDTSSSSSSSSSKSTTTETEESYAYVPDYTPISVSDSDFTSSLENNFTISNLRGIFGMPYQFMASADPRVSDSSDGIGRKYASEIVANMPLLLMTAGKPVFMAQYSDSEKKTILKKFIDAASGNEAGIRDTVLSDKGFGKYYSLEYAYEEYFEYVNPMCRIAARVLGVHDYTIDGVKLDSYNWYNKANAAFTKLFSTYRGCTAWYCESETSISDNFSNGTSESMLGSKINSLSDYGRELNFILGTVKSGTGVALDKFTSVENLATNMQNVEDMLNSTLGSNKLGGIFNSITGAAQTVVAGGKIVFPEIWSESSFSRSYTINLKLVSPDGDDLSIYLNIIVPMLHLLGLVLPRQAADTANGFAYGYISPFLVRAFYKGFFNVDMGIITDLSFNKGRDSAWNANGVPTIVDVSFTIKDLYSDMYMSKMDNKYNMLKNIILMDYISNMCGVNINEVDVMRGIDLFLIQNVKNRITDTWHLKIWGKLDQWVSNKYQSIFGKF